MLCASCGYENREGARFCLGCGASLALSCPGCGKELQVSRGVWRSFNLLRWTISAVELHGWRTCLRSR